MLLPLLFQMWRLHHRLLETAKQAIDDNYPQMAIVISATACELCVEQAVEVAIQRRNVGILSDWIQKQCRTYTLRNDTVYDLYVILTNDQFRQSALWPHYRELVDLRNAIVHQGEEVTQARAEALHLIACQVVQHIEQVCQQPNP